MTAGATGRGIIDPVLFLWPMAYNKSKGKQRMSKIEPAVMTLTFATPASDPGVRTQSWIDLSQVVSLVNRRFYRQGLNWAVGGFKVSSLQTGAVNIMKLPNTWIMSNAWEKSMRVWQRMNKEALAETESIRPRFLDFKVFAGSDHHLSGAANNLLPVAFGAGGIGNTAKRGEWNYSKIVTPNTVLPGTSIEFEVLATGPSFPGLGASGVNAVSMIEGYASSRGLPDIRDPNTPGDAVDTAGPVPENWMQAIFNEGTDQDNLVVQDMVTENNIAPYPFENGENPLGGVYTDTQYPGGANQLIGLELHDFVNIFASNLTDGVGIQRLKGGNFPCGLLSIDWTPSIDASESNLLLQIDMIPGSHRGYLCEPMTEM